MNRRRTQALSLLLLALLLPVAARAQAPAAEEILRSAREASQRQQATLRAQLRDEDGNKTPFIISVADGVVNYDFRNPDLRIQLVIGDDDAKLREGVPGSTKEVKSGRYNQPVRGTAITYEDIAMRPLYWAGPRLLGDDSIMGRSAWKLEVPAPKGASQYGAARLWIDKESGGALKIEVYGKDGRIVKEFSAKSVQTIKGRWTFKTMRIQSYDPTTHRRGALTYLDLLGEAS